MNLTTTLHCINPGSYSYKLTIWSSILMAIGGMGDALLYIYLPVNGNTLGLSALSVGIILSVNRFIRFFSNRWMAWISSKWGMKKILLLGVLLSSLTTTIYAFNPAMWIWVLSRMFWGIAYSSLRFTTAQYAGHHKNTGSALGLNRGIYEVGPLLVYLVGPMMITTLGAQLTFLILGIFVVAALPIFLMLPDISFATQKIRPFSFKKANYWDSLTFIIAFISDGLIIVGITWLLPLERNLDELLIAGALYLSLRKLINIFVSPLFGWISDLIGFNRVFNGSCFLLVTGLILIMLDKVSAGIIITFISAAINITLVPVYVFNQAPISERFESLTTLQTSRDLGAALGTLSGLTLLQSFSTQELFGFAIILIVTIWFLIYKRYQSNA